MTIQRFQMLLTAKRPISHHDPKTGNDSNTLTFNRQKQIIKRKSTDEPIYRHLLEKIYNLNQMPESVSWLMDRLSIVEWMSVAYIRTFLDLHNNQGLLDGFERYRMLENRLQTAAARSHRLHQMWAMLVHDLQSEFHEDRNDDLLTSFWTLPPGIQYQIVEQCITMHRPVVALARLWHQKNKAQSVDYMEAAGKLDEYQEEAWIKASFADDEVPFSSNAIVLAVPQVSENSLRHQMVREPAFLHLCSQLGFEAKARGEGTLTMGAESIFYNGGNIQAGATQPTNVFKLAGQIRNAFPSLDLLGGVTSSFDLGESKLKLNAWIVCAENAACLPESLRQTDRAQMSIFDMLDTVTRTRQASPSGEGQMIYNYEVLIQGTQVYVEMTLAPFTTELTQGALAAALNYYEKNDRVIGGQSARGHGQVAIKWLSERPQGQDLYETYLRENKDALLYNMESGTLGSDSTVIKK